MHYSIENTLEMNTISINTQLYEFAANYASENNISISSLVEDFLTSLRKNAGQATAKQHGTKHKKYVMKEVSELSSIVQQLAGIAKTADNNFDDLNGIEAKTEYLTDKYKR